jgi:UDP-N-acetylmuramate: L-alanyl-gamma-D-glutamyl-meso-diaminopimelate ligase
MVAGARLALEAGWEVRGSDSPLYPPTSDMVAALGVPVATRYDPANLDWRPDVVVIGNVLSRGNAEVEAVLERRLRYISLPEWLKEVVLRDRCPIVISGTHGKTTTTALTAFLLDAAGLDPGFLIGGQALDFEHSARLGPVGGPFVIEGDEYDTAFFDKRAKFFHYLPEIAVVTSIEFDHGDIYRDIEEIETAFRRMLRQVPRSGLLLLCADDERVLALRNSAFSEVQTYGLNTGADWRGELLQDDPGRPFTMRVLRDGAFWGEFRLPLAGVHNARNALAAVATAARLGVIPAVLAESLPRFRGVRRRLEVFHRSNGVVFVDDFAHHPTAIRETIAAARAHWPGRRLWAAFEPRSNTTVTRRFQNEVAEALSGADVVWLGPLYREQLIPEDQRLDREAVVRTLRALGREAGAATATEDIVAALADGVEPGDVVLIMSNGAFDGIYERIRNLFRDSAPDGG